MKYFIGCVLFCSLFGFSFKAIYSETGRASFYANKFNGRRTSSGEIFNQEYLTAAHKKIKLGTFVKVTNLENDSTIVLKVNDRLGKSSGHTIDVTKKAAEHLNFVQNGSAKVLIEILE
ncbi:MAG: septal ring lytic transglycosylase RlpA family protein [Flavobacteriia bacterium]|nr:septal ring lytic transglycosylase RlpA family protein [Flavobacteriia bacterium]